MMPPHVTPTQCREDLDYLVDTLAREHRHLHHSVSRERFESAVRSLRARIPLLTGPEIVVELARLVALIGDGHTCLPLAEVAGFRRYPLRLYHFADGLFVQAVAREHCAMAGARLLAIDGTPALEAYDAMRPLISRDNEMGVRAEAPTLLTIPEVLQARGVVANPEQVPYVVQQTSGERLTCILHPMDALPSELAAAGDGAAAAAPLWLRHPSEQNWCEYLPDHRAVYVQYSRVRDGQDESLAAFFDRIFALVEREEAERLILDIRLNGGGNMSLNHPLLYHLIRCGRVNKWGKLFVLIGRCTFSAAMNLAVDLERHTRALFVGEPTRGSPNHYGENVEIVLPHSGLYCSASAFWWQYSLPDDDRPWLAPDIPAPLWSEDFATNRDPALDAALAYEPVASQSVDDRRGPHYFARMLR